MGLRNHFIEFECQWGRCSRLLDWIWLRLPWKLKSKKSCMTGMMKMTRKVEDWQGIDTVNRVWSLEFNKNFTKSRVTKCDPTKPCPFVPAVSERSLRSLNQKRLVTSLVSEYPQEIRQLLSVFSAQSWVLLSGGFLSSGCGIYGYLVPGFL